MIINIKSKNKPNQNVHMAAIIWVVFFCYAICAALIFQKLLLPITSSVNAGGGLLPNDSASFDYYASILAEQIRLNGWSAWHLYPNHYSTGNVAILGALYALFGHDPALMIPINAAIHALGGLLVYLISRELSANKIIGMYAGVVAATLFVIFPSALNWYGQIHKDGFAIAGSLLILFTWLKAIRNEHSLSNWLVISLLYFIGVFLVLSVRPYNLKLMLIATLGAWFAIIIFSMIRRQFIKKIKLTAFFLIAIITIVVAIKSVGFLAGERSSIAGERASFAGEGDTYATWQGNGKWQWENASWLPDEIEQYVELASKTRAALIDYGLQEKAKSIVDKDVAPQNIQEVALYLPRALQVGLFAPFPSTWFDNLSLIRIVAAGEMFIYYLCIPGIFLLLLYNRKPAVFVAVYFACFFLMVYGFTTANIGTLYRLRYAYEFVILLLGVLGWFTWLHKTGRLKRLVDMVQVPRQLPKNEEVVIDNTPVKRKEVIITGSTVMALTLLCFIAFFLRDILMARTFGLGADTDNFFIALLIPMFIVTVFCLPLGAALIPIYLKIKEGGNIQDSKALVSNVSFWCTFVLFVICLALYIFGPNLLILLYPDGVLPDMSKLVPLMDMSLLILLFSGMVVLGNSVLNAHGKGALSSAAQLVVPIVAILALYMFSSTYGVLAIMLGMVVGQLLNLLIVQYYLRRYQISLLPILKPGGYSQAIFLSSQYFPLAASAFFIAVAAPISTLLAMTLPDGSVSAFNLGSKMVLFITGLVSTTVTTVMLPYFSMLVAKNHLMSARRELSFFLLLATFISIPISGIFFVWADFIVRSLFEGGAFDTNATEQVVRVMQYAVVQLPFFVCNAILLKFATATKHVISISLIAILSLLVNIGVSFLLMKHMGVAGIALGSSISVIFATVLLVLALVRFWHISKFDALVMLLNWLLFLTLLMGLHFRSITSVYAVILAYVVLLFGYFSSLKAEKLLKNWVKN